MLRNNYIYIFFFFSYNRFKANFNENRMNSTGILKHDLNRTLLRIVCINGCINRIPLPYPVDLSDLPPTSSIFVRATGAKPAKIYSLFVDNVRPRFKQNKPRYGDHWRNVNSLCTFLYTTISGQSGVHTLRIRRTTATIIKLL